jgi:hypothetical protein
VPQPLNPATDPTGKNCAQNQNGPFWFLEGTTGKETLFYFQLLALSAIMLHIQT